MNQTPNGFQAQVRDWMHDCFGQALSDDRTERNRRYLEESLELVQSLGGSREQAHALVDYVFSRPAGQPAQEVGGAMVTLAALCEANGLDMQAAAEQELARILDPRIMAQIRERQTRKPQL
ncbi:hypothetical protein SAMN05421774_101844 [Gemmobacter megaterium]|uniref:Uncharacterized protein n=1 Tax=Gemmobacter megaterium TaxID=1086013 RepID=A0A1N7L1R8_9RHOB|nr:hypothetical protein [Gemmobacter megaterium]GGE05131.1 hypothetical protein GCM10011345_08260 [Gemmobacter megaterium]SIS67795.1 hypothetical protein SAMN05421774_101844 [Gemmobacter megaterium]